MIRILQSVNVMDRAGLETVLMNYYRNMDHSLIQFDFLTHREESGAYDEEITSLGGYVYHAPRLYPQNYVAYFKYMKKFLGEHKEYKVVHSHIDSMSYFPLLAAKVNGVPVRVSHSHSSKLDRDLKLPIKYFALKRITKVANEFFACGELAGRFMYKNKDFFVLNNAIDLEKFRFQENIREDVRNDLGISQKFVIGHVGRYCYIKNQDFLIDVFKEFLRFNNDAVLLLIGKGEDEQKLRVKVHELNLDDKVLFLKDRADVDRLYQAMDIFIMPSLFEGLPVVAVEAQANGLPCIFSDKISSEVLLSHSASQIPLNDGVIDWVKKILETDIKRNVNATKELQENGYDIKEEAKKLQDWYIKKYNEC